MYRNLEMLYNKWLVFKTDTVQEIRPRKPNLARWGLMAGLTLDPVLTPHYSTDSFFNNLVHLGAVIVAGFVLIKVVKSMNSESSAWKALLDNVGWILLGGLAVAASIETPSGNTLGVTIYQAAEQFFSELAS